MTPAQLQAKYPYMFESKDEYAYSFARGWFPDFARLCEQIDALLGEDKRKFRWRQIKEKFGSARYYWGMKGHAPVNVDVLGVGRMTTRPPKRSDLATRLTSLIADAEARTRMTCIACGAPGALDRNFGYLLTLCAEHTAERKANRDQISMEIWPGDDDDMSIEISPEREAEIARVIADRARVLEAATQVAGGDRDAASIWYTYEVLQPFQKATAAQLVAQGRTENVLRHLASLEAGSLMPAG